MAALAWSQLNAGAGLSQVLPAVLSIYSFICQASSNYYLPSRLALKIARGLVYFGSEISFLISIHSFDYIHSILFNIERHNGGQARPIEPIYHPHFHHSTPYLPPVDKIEFFFSQYNILGSRKMVLWNMAYLPMAWSSVSYNPNNPEGPLQIFVELRLYWLDDYFIQCFLAFEARL